MAGLEIRGTGSGLLDEPLALELRGGGGAAATWRARIRDDDGRVWRAVAPRAEELEGVWAPAKPAGPIAALTSLHPVKVDLRAELADGAFAVRTITRVLVGE